MFFRKYDQQRRPRLSDETRANSITPGRSVDALDCQRRQRQLLDRLHPAIGYDTSSTSVYLYSSKVTGPGQGHLGPDGHGRDAAVAAAPADPDSRRILDGSVLEPTGSSVSLVVVFSEGVYGMQQDASRPWTAPA